MSLQQSRKRPTQYLWPAALALLLLAGCAARPAELGESLRLFPSPAAQGGDKLPADPTPPPDPTPLSEPAPEPTAPPLEQPVELARFGTPIHDWNENRINNIRLACRAVEGHIIESDQTFSFNETVGRRTPERGYLESIIFVGEERELEVGGGICQLSTTLYNAALLAGLEVTEHHVHSQPVTYIEQGMDATVYYGSLDLRFYNNSGHPLQLSTLMEEGVLTVSITAMPG